MRKNIATVLTLALTLLFVLAACDDGSGDVTETNSAPEASLPFPEPNPIPVPPPTPVPPTETGMTLPYQLDTADLFGNPVTAETLGEKEVFFIHLWATWCPPCVAEMPEFPELISTYEDRVGFLALLIDYEDEKDSAADMVREFGIPDTFYMVDAFAPSVSEMLELLDSGYIPTTVLVSKDGAGSQIVGAVGLSGYSSHIDALLD